MIGAMARDGREIGLAACRRQHGETASGKAESDNAPRINRLSPAPGG